MADVFDGLADEAGGISAAQVPALGAGLADADGEDFGDPVESITDVAQGGRTA